MELEQEIPRTESESEQHNYQVIANSLKTFQECLNLETERLKEELKVAQDSAEVRVLGVERQLQRLLDSCRTAEREKLEFETERDGYKSICEEFKGQLQALLQRNGKEKKEIRIIRDNVEDLESKVKSLEAVISQTRPQLEAPQEIVVNQNDASTEHARLDEKQEVGEKLKDENAQQIKALKEKLHVQEELLQNLQQKVKEQEDDLAQVYLEAAWESREAIESLQVELMQVKHDVDDFSQQIFEGKSDHDVSSESKQGSADSLFLGRESLEFFTRQQEMEHQIEIKSEAHQCLAEEDRTGTDITPVATESKTREKAREESVKRRAESEREAKFRQKERTATLKLEYYFEEMTTKEPSLYFSCFTRPR